MGTHKCYELPKCKENIVDFIAFDIAKSLTGISYKNEKRFVYYKKGRKCGI